MVKSLPASKLLTGYVIAIYFSFKLVVLQVVILQNIVHFLYFLKPSSNVFKMKGHKREISLKHEDIGHIEHLGLKVLLSAGINNRVIRQIDCVFYV